MYKKEKFKLSPEDIEAYKSGESAFSIAKRKNISQTSVARELENLGIKLDYSPYRISDRDIEAYKSGESANSIGKRNNISESSVTRELEKLGIKREYSRNKAELSEADISAYLKGESTLKIAARTGISVSSVRKALIRAGVELRSKIEHAIDPNRGDIYRVSAEDISAYERGESAYSIGQRTDVAAQTVIRALKREGIETRTWEEAEELKSKPFYY